MSTSAAETYTPRLKERYEQEIRPRLKEELGVDSIMQVPEIEKITLNMGVGEAKTDSKALDSAIEELTTIAGQRAQVDVGAGDNGAGDAQNVGATRHADQADRGVTTGADRGQ